jgi:hypothetical protein
MRSIGVEDKEEMDLSVCCIFIYDDERESVCVYGASSEDGEWEKEERSGGRRGRKEMT